MTNHIGSIESELVGDSYTAACSCGWKGDERTTEAAAGADLDRHYAESQST